MPKYIARERLAEAVNRLAGFKDTVTAQGLQHILPFLALKRKGANTATEVQFEEKDDFDFWDKYLLVDDADSKGRYYDPFAGGRRIAGHPHSNVATARKGTFVGSWHAAEVRKVDGASMWRLSGNYLDIIKDKCLSRGGDRSRIPALDLVVWMRRHDALPDNATVDSLLTWLRDEFRLSAVEYDAIFDSGPSTPSAERDPGALPLDSDG